MKKFVALLAFLGIFSAQAANPPLLWGPNDTAILLQSGLTTRTGAAPAMPGATFSSAIGLPSGTAASPSWYWTADSSGRTGMYRGAQDEINMSMNGTNTFRFARTTGPVIQGANASGETNFIIGSQATGALALGSSSASTAGRNLFMYGESHATKANLLELRVGSTPDVTVLSNGNVGIGSATPAQKLDVTGSIAASSAMTSVTATHGSTSTTTPLKVVRDVSAGDSTNVVEMIVGNSGSSQGYAAFQYTNAAASSTPTANIGFYPRNNAGSGQINPANITFTKTSAADTATIRIANDANYIFLASTGNVGIGTTSPSYRLDVQGGDINASGSVRSAGVALTSDERLKEEITPLAESLKKITSLNGYHYFWRDKKKIGKDIQVGLIAQEVEKVFPEVVSRGTDGYLAIDYPHLVAPLVESIKELDQRTKIQARRIEELENQVQSLIKKAKK